MSQRSGKGVVLDIDGVLADSYTPLKEYVCRELGISPDEVEDKDAWDFYTYFPEHHQKQAQQLIDKAFWKNEAQVYTNSLPLEGAQRIARLLPVVGYVTRRPETAFKDTLAWLDEHDFPKQPLLLASEDYSKATLIWLLGSNTIIEDSPKEAVALADQGVNVILMDARYNREVAEHPNIRRVENWHAIIELDPSTWTSEGQPSLTEAIE